MRAMEVIVGLHNIKPRHEGCVLTIGGFDGVHRGHRMLLDRLVGKSRELGAPSMLVTFEPTPREYFRGGMVPARLTRFREKVTLLGATDLDRVLSDFYYCNFSVFQSLPDSWAIGQLFPVMKLQ